MIYTCIFNLFSSFWATVQPLHLGMVVVLFDLFLLHLSCVNANCDSTFTSIYGKFLSILLAFSINRLHIQINTKQVRSVFMPLICPSCLEIICSPFFPPAFLHLNSCIRFRARDFSVLIAAMFIHLLHSTVYVSYRYCRCVVSV